MEHRCFCPWSIIIFILQKSILVFNGQKNSATELDFCKVNQSFYWSKPLPSQGKKIKFWFQLVDKNTWLCFLKNIPQNFICTMNSFGCFLFRNWNSFRFLNRRSLFKRASEFFKSLTYLLKDIFNIFCKTTCNLDGLLTSFFIHFFPNCTSYQYLLLSFEPEILWTRNYEMYHCARNNYLFVTSTPSKNNTQTRSLYSFFVPPKSKFLPWELFSKNGVLSYFIASIDLELFTTSPKPPIFNLSNIKSIIKINFLPPIPFFFEIRSNVYWLSNGIPSVMR